MECADLDEVPWRPAGGGGVVVAEAEVRAALAAEEPGPAREEAARADVEAPELVQVAEPVVVDGAERHRRRPASPDDAVRRVLPRVRAQLQVVPARPAADRRIDDRSRSSARMKKQRFKISNCNAGEVRRRPGDGPVGDGGGEAPGKENRGRRLRRVLIHPW